MGKDIRRWSRCSGGRAAAMRHSDGRCDILRLATSDECFRDLRQLVAGAPHTALQPRGYVRGRAG